LRTESKRVKGNGQHHFAKLYFWKLYTELGAQQSRYMPQSQLANLR